MTQKFLDDLDYASRVLLAEPRRTYLGASQVGDTCARAVWASWRWVLDVQFDGRMRRLFGRGHEEEARFWRWLEAMYILVRPWAERLVYHPASDSFATIPWEQDFLDELEDVSTNPAMIYVAKCMGVEVQQWGFTDHEGHYSGHNDGHVYDLSEYWPVATGWGILECKTHGEKSFNDLKSKGVQASKPEHYVQMQTYMKYDELKWALYMAVNKNTDEIYVELVEIRPEVGDAYADRAHKIIHAQTPPARISNDPSFFGCRFCDFKRQCQHAEEVEKNCRSCQYASPAPGGQWECGLHRQNIPADFIKVGCDKWLPVDIGGR